MLRTSLRTRGRVASQLALCAAPVLRATPRVPHIRANTVRDSDQTSTTPQATAYVDLALAETAKEEGNAAFKAADYPAAVAAYSEALRRGPAGVWPEAYKVHSNRAACYTKLGALPEGRGCLGS